MTPPLAFSHIIIITQDTLREICYVRESSAKFCNKNVSLKTGPNLLHCVKLSSSKQVSQPIRQPKETNLKQAQSSSYFSDDIDST